LRRRAEFVVNIVSLYLSNTMFESSKNHTRPREVDEFEKTGLIPPSVRSSKPPR
jgi:flavin reductase (DIM6/NTAB) family NADH-FMN oxidoreductase RutF